MFVRLQKIQHQRPVSKRSFARFVWGIGKLVFILALIAVGGWFFLQHKIQTDLKDQVQAKISEGLDSTGIVAELGQARFHEGKGIQLNDLRVSLASFEQPIRPEADRKTNIEIYEAFLHAPATVTELATGALDIQAVELRRAKMTIVRSADGSWDFSQAIKQLVAAPSKKNPIPVALRDCEVQLVDLSKPQSASIKLTGLNVFVQPIEFQGRTLLQINGDFQSRAISKVEFTTYIDQEAETWNTKIGASQARINEELIKLLPAAAQSDFQDLNRLNGVINFTAQATGLNSLEEMPKFRLNGNIQQLSVDDPRLPFALDNVTADFQMTDSGFSVSNSSGRIGNGRFENINYSQNGLLDRKQWHFGGALKQFEFKDTPRIRKWLTPNSQRFCDEFSPEGISDISFSFTHDGTNLTKREIKTDLTDMAFSFFKMPYLVENCVGRVEIIDDHCGFKVQSIAGRQQCEVKGFAKGLGTAPTFQIEISVPGDVPIDQKFMDAIDAQPKLAKVIRSFQPTGRVGGFARIEKRVPNGVISKDFDIQLKQCSIRHKNFDYPIHNVNGVIQTRNDQFTFSNLTGNNGSGKVICNGVWNPQNGLFARFLCESISLNDQLRFALKPEIQEIWNGFRPRGTLDFMRVDMTLPPNEKEVDLVVEARMEKPKDIAQANYVSIHPIWFPYEINRINGMVNIGKGEIKLTNFKGLHQNTWIVCQGDGRYSDDAWSVKLKDLLVGSLKVDEDLLAAVPKSLAPPLRKLKFEGLLNVKGEFTVAGSKQVQQTPSSTQLARHQHNVNGDLNPNGGVRHASFTPIESEEHSTSLAWNIRLDMNQAKMQIGFPLENVFGMVTLVGEYDGNNATCRGDVDIDSLIMYDLQLTKIRGPIWMDNDRSAAGIFAQPKPVLTGQQNVSPIANSPQPSSLTGQLHKGTVHFDAEMSSGEKGEFYIQATLGDGCLKTACRELAPGLKNVEGHSFAAVRMAGDQTGTHTHRGDGKIQLRDAKIYELPVFLSLLKILKIKQADRTAFDSSNIDFQIHGDTFDFNRMEFIGDAISLLGNGKMNLDRDINLNFYSVVGRNRLNIPLLSELYKAGSQKVLWINVDGKLENPQTHRHVLPQLNESLQQLFQPNLEARNREGRPGGLIGRTNRQTQNYSSTSSLQNLQPSLTTSPNQTWGYNAGNNRAYSNSNSGANSTNYPNYSQPAFR